MCSQWWCVVLCAVLMLKFDCVRGRHWQHHEDDHEDSTLLGLQQLSAPPSLSSHSSSSSPSAVTIAPLFMRLLLRQAESGRLPLTGDTGDGFRALARSAPPLEVSMDPDGHVQIRFGAAPDPPGDSDLDSGVCVVVLAFRDRPPDLEDADLSVELRDELGDVHRTPVPSRKAFVSFAARCPGSEGLRLTASILGAATPLDGVAVLEIGGAQLGPLLVRSKSHILADGPTRVWTLPADDLSATNEEETHRKHRRRRRMRRHGSDEANAENDQCHLQEWVVSTEEMGWNFVIYPTSISVNLCVGECTSPLLIRRHYNATTHAIARDVYRMNSNNPDANDVPSAKCVPIQYRKLALLIERSPGAYSLETNSDLSASRCGCR